MYVKTYQQETSINLGDLKAAILADPAINTALHSNELRWDEDIATLCIHFEIEPLQSEIDALDILVANAQ